MLVPLVRFALRRPITILVLVIALALAAWLAVKRMPADIFPQVGSPTIYVAQPYGGMDPAQMEGYMTYYYEYHFLYITGIDHVESKSIQGPTNQLDTIRTFVQKPARYFTPERINSFL